MLSYENSVKAMSRATAMMEDFGSLKGRDPEERLDKAVHLIFGSYEILFDLLAKESPDPMLRRMAADILSEVQVSDIEVGVLIDSIRESREL